MKRSLIQTLRQDMKAVRDRDPAARGRLEVVLAYPGFHALVAHRFAARLWTVGFRLTARLLSHIARWMTGIEIHPGAAIGDAVFIDHGMAVVIGETSVIGDNCTLYHGVTLGGTSLRKEKRHPTLGDDVIVGAGAKLLGPIEVGDGAMIGANSVVVRDVPAGATVVGIPGRLTRKRAEGEADQDDRHWRPEATVGAEDVVMERLQALEAEIRTLKGLPPLEAADDEDPMIRGSSGKIRVVKGDS